MIELGMVRRMATRALLLAPVVLIALYFFGGLTYALSGAAGTALTLVNLWVAARIIGTVAENTPQLLLPAGLISFALGLGILYVLALALRESELVNLAVMGFTLIGYHFGLVLWEAPGAYQHARPTADARS